MGRLPARLEAPGRGRGVVAAAAVLLVASIAVALLATGVRVDELVRFAAYEAVYVLAPGLVAYRALAGPAGGPIRQLALGWTIGYALEVLAFTVTGVTGTRDAFWVYPIVALAIAGPFALRRSRPRRGDGDGSEPGGGGRGPIAVALALSAVAVAYLALGFYAQTPIPDRIDAAGYYADSPFHLSVAAEAKHQWPLEQPNVAGEELNYHINGYLHMAAVSEVTGVELPVVVYRYFHVPLLVLSALLLFVLGRQLGGSRWVGPLAAALILLGGELDLDPIISSPLSGDLLESSILSPTILFSVPFFLAAAILTSDLLVGRASDRRGAWLCLAIVLYGAAGAKGTTLPVLAAGLGCFLLWRYVRERRVDRVAAAVLGLVVFALVMSVLLLYENSGEVLELRPFAHLLDFSVIGAEADGWAASVISAAFTALSLSLAMLGIGWYLTREGRRILGPRQVWLLSLLAGGTLPFLVFDQAGDNQIYFLYYGLFAGAAVSAQGLTLFWKGWSSWQRNPGPRLAAFVLLALAAVAAGTAVAFATDLPVVDRVGRLTEVSSDLSLLGRYRIELVAAVAAVVAVVVLARLLSPPAPGNRAAGVGLAVVVVMSIGLLDSPLDYGPRPVRAWTDGTPAHFEPYPEALRGVSRPLVEGLEWVRDNTDDDATLAVNNQTLDEAETVPKYFHYSALAERRVFLEGWEYTDRGQELGKERIQAGEHAFPERARLNDQAFEGDRAALLELGRRGVDYLVVDHLNGDQPTPALPQASPVYSNSAISVYRLESLLAEAPRQAPCRRAGRRPAPRAPSSAQPARASPSPEGC